MPKKTLLIIDNSHVLMELTKRILERVGYTVRCSFGQAGAGEFLMDYTPDGIILENELPDGSGIELCRELREKYSIPIMLVSGSKDDEVSSLSAGATDFMKKPFLYDLFKTRLNAMMCMQPATTRGRRHEKQ